VLALERTGESLAESDSGSESRFVYGARRPGPVAKVLMGIFFLSPFVALLALVGLLLGGHGVPWFAIALTIVLIVVVGHGVTIGFHRLFAHQSFEAKRPLKVALAALGSMSFQGSIIGWVADHRRHHRYADRPGDPHSPIWKDDTPVSGLRGLWHAHVGWLFHVDTTSREQYARDLLADRDLVWIDRLFVPLAIATFVVPFALGYVWSGWSGALTALLCAGFVRVGLMLNGTWSVNSICHRFGKRPFATRDVSTNFAPLAVFTMGESWHNNHHAFPRSARHGFGPGQIDSSARIIQWFEALGWATNVNLPSPDHIALRSEQVG
jgi:stearoyl-CoA desaturase (delta-9 desaturase)